jgi:hypothetical protein
LGGPTGDRLAAQHQPCQRLADLVVQLARDPAPLGLLRGQGAQPALAALTLEPVEHLVERPGQGHHLLVAAIGVDPLTRRKRIDARHQAREPLQRRQRPPK